MYLFLGKPKIVSHLKAYRAPFQGKDRQRVPIAIIDDQEFPYLQLLRDHHYNIQTFPDIQDVRVLSEFPIVLCDIRGVGKTFSTHFEGASLISETRKFYPTKIIIAYTSQSYDPSYSPLLQQADDQFKKDLDSDDWIEHLDAAIEKALDPTAQWTRLRDILLKKDVPLWQLMQLEDEFVCYITHKQPTFPRERTAKALSSEARSLLTDFAGSVVAHLIVSGLSR